MNLRNKFSGRSKDKGSGVGLSSTVTVIGRGSRQGSLTEKGVQNGEEETGSFTGTSLGTSHEISSTGDNGDRVFLDGGWGLVSCKLNVVEECGVDGGLSVGENSNGFRDIGTGSLDGDIGVLVKVDTSCLLLASPRSRCCRCWGHTW